MAQIGLLEDNARIAKLCVTMLHYAGHQVAVYEHARACLDALLSLPAAPESRYFGYSASSHSSLPIDILILDLHLPDIDGLEVIRLLRMYPHTRTLPLIFCTAATTSEIASALDLAPQAAFIEKPFTFRALTSAITDMLEARVQ